MNVLNPVQYMRCAATVAIPAHNEKDHIAPCLTALARQDFGGCLDVVAFLNNCTDGTPDIVRRLVPSLPFRLHVLERRLEPSEANAGIARKLAMEAAGAISSADGVVLTTDADSRVPPDWVSSHVAVIAGGADAVAGMVEMDPDDAAALPFWLQAEEDRAQAFGTLLDEIDYLLDPDPVDPWPRHTQHSGANIAIRADSLARVGGIPPISLGEDRALFAALRRADARIRHSREGVVTVSGRLVGRARGGMADTIARRLAAPDEWLDDCFEPALHRVRRARLRASLRKVWAKGLDGTEAVIRRLCVSSTVARQALARTTFGNAWSDLEEASPILRRQLVPASALEAETRRARRIVGELRARAEVIGPEHPGDRRGSAFV
jgi:glycosyltransferase involved in cell wall biosynthesis